MDRPRLPLTDRLAALVQTQRGRRAIGLGAALAIEALLLLALLALGVREDRAPVPIADVSTFDVRETAAPDLPPEPEPEEERSALVTEPRPAPEPPAQPVTAPEPAPPPPAAVIPRPAPAAPAAPVREAASPPGARVYGPPAPSRPRESARVGTAPGGQPLYAAAWYRRPREDELRGYLSSAQPGYATISCRTVPDFRVEDCVLETEYPSGSDMGRAVLAMAWQFRVRPPILGGRYQVGEWVRIRITYTVTEQFEY